MSTTLTSRPSTITRRVIAGQSIDIHVGVVAVGVGLVGARPQQAVLDRPRAAADASSARRGLPYQRACADRDRHRQHAAPLLGPVRGRRQAPLRRRAPLRGAAVAHRPPAARAGPRLRRGDPHATSRSSPPSPTRAPSRRCAPGRRPATSSTSPRTATPRRHGATARWLERIGAALRRALLLRRQGRPLPRDRDRAADRRLAGQPRGRRRRGDRAPPRSSHPWNRDICEEEDIVCAADWPGLARALEPLLQGAPR